MNSIFTYIASLAIGVCAGSLSGYHLIRQVSAYNSGSSRYIPVLALLRLGSLGLIAWYLLHWGPVPFILFGGSMMIAKWVAILCLNE